MKKIDISVVICVSDDIKIENMLNSIKDKCEVVVVLNGATKEVVDIVNKYKASKIFDLKIVEIDERNLSKSRNIGTINSKYNKVVYYDSDCIVVSDALTKYSIILDEFDLVDGKVKFKSDTFQSKVISVMRNMGLPGYALCPSIGLNKKIIKKINYYFDEDIKWVEDTEMNNRAKSKNVKVGVIDTITCIHDNLTFKKDLQSAFRYGTGVKISSKKGLHKKRPTANWNLIIPCFRKNIVTGLYSIVWNLVYCMGYYFS